MSLESDLHIKVDGNAPIDTSLRLINIDINIFTVEIAFEV